MSTRAIGVFFHMVELVRAEEYGCDGLRKKGNCTAASHMAARLHRMSNRATTRCRRKHVS